MDNRYIGVFDSGIGGLTVVKSIMESLPKENIVYFGDTAHVPYGTRSESQIKHYVLSDVNFLSTFDLKAIVIACNTADSVARSTVEAHYKNTPVFGVVHPASKQAAETTENGKIGVIATKATVSSGSYEKAIHSVNPDIEVYSAACPLLVPLVENGRTVPGDVVVETVVREYLDPLIALGIDTLVLGCTHYPLLTDVIAKLYPDLRIISSSGAAADTLRATLTEQGLLAEGAAPDHQYFVSDDAESFEMQAKVFIGDALDSPVEHVTIE